MPTPRCQGATIPCAVAVLALRTSRARQAVRAGPWPQRPLCSLLRTWPRTQAWKYLQDLPSGSFRHLLICPLWMAVVDLDPSGLPTVDLSCFVHGLMVDLPDQGAATTESRWHHVAPCGTTWHHVAPCGTMWHLTASTIGPSNPKLPMVSARVQAEQTLKLLSGG